MAKYVELLNILLETAAENRTTFHTILGGITHKLVKFQPEEGNPFIIEAVLLRETNGKIKSKQVCFPLLETRTQSMINQLAENVTETAQQIFVSL